MEQRKAVSMRAAASATGMLALGAVEPFRKVLNVVSLRAGCTDGLPEGLLQSRNRRKHVDHFRGVL
jgi:hypothetical protein